MILYLTEGDIRVRTFGRDVPVLAIATSVEEAHQAMVASSTLSVIRVIDHSEGSMVLLADCNNLGTKPEET